MNPVRERLKKIIENREQIRDYKKFKEHLERMSQRGICNYFWKCGTTSSQVPYSIRISPMKKIKDVVENVEEENEKVGYDPEKDTNWCHLPVEIREKCIKWMDFMSRMQIRKTAATEKSYVDGQKYNYSSGTIRAISRLNQKTSKSEVSIFVTLNQSLFKDLKKFESKVTLDPTTTAKLPFNSFLKSCEIDRIKLYSKGGIPKDLAYLTDCGQFRFKSLYVKCEDGNLNLAKMFLKNSVGDVENIHLNVKDFDNFSIGTLLDLEAFTKSKRVFIEYMNPDYFLEAAEKLAQKWDEQNAEVGTRMCFSSKEVKFNYSDTVRETKYVAMKNPAKRICFKYYTKKIGKVEATVVSSP